MPLDLGKKTSVVSDPLESVNRPAKMTKLDDGRNSSFSGVSSNIPNINGASTSQVSGTGSLPVNAVPQSEEVKKSPVIYSCDCFNCPHYFMFVFQFIFMPWLVVDGYCVGHCH